MTTKLAEIDPTCGTEQQHSIGEVCWNKNVLFDLVLFL